MTKLTKILFLITLAQNISAQNLVIDQGFEKAQHGLTKGTWINIGGTSDLWNAKNPDDNINYGLCRSVAPYEGEKQTDNYDIIIEGHTDNVGSQAYNQELSERRANEVKNILVEHGLKIEAIKNFAYGSSKNTSVNNTEQSRQSNRRVDIILRYKNKFNEDQQQSLNDLARLYGFKM